MSDSLTYKIINLRVTNLHNQNILSTMSNFQVAPKGEKKWKDMISNTTREERKREKGRIYRENQF